MFITLFPFDLLEQFYIVVRFIVAIGFITLFGVFVIAGDLITILIAVELFLLVVMIGAIVIAGFTADPIGELFVLTVLVVGAAETAVALSIVTLYYQAGSMTGVDFVSAIEALQAENNIKEKKNGV